MQIDKKQVYFYTILCWSRGTEEARLAELVQDTIQQDWSHSLTFVQVLINTSKLFSFFYEQKLGSLLFVEIGWPRGMRKENSCLWRKMRLKP